MLKLENFCFVVRFSRSQIFERKIEVLFPLFLPDTTINCAEIFLRTSLISLSMHLFLKIYYFNKFCQILQNLHQSKNTKNVSARTDNFGTTMREKVDPVFRPCIPYISQKKVSKNFESMITFFLLSKMHFLESFRIFNSAFLGKS